MGQAKPVVVLVDDSATYLELGKTILKEKYETFPVNCAAALFQLLPNIEPDLILLDIEMPGTDGYEALKRLKTEEKTADVPVIFLTAKKDSESEFEGLSLGAVDYISKPFAPPLLLKRIETHLAMREAARTLKAHNTDLLQKVNEKNSEITELQNAILRVVAELVEFRDDSNNGHIERTQKYLSVFIEMMKKKKVYFDEVSQWNLEYFIPAAQLYDVGKIAISDILLNKPAKFSREEFELMKKHTIFGVAAIKEIEQQTKENLFLDYAKIFAGTHHEKWDGSGYPEQLKGKDIPLPGRIMTIVDVYDGLISARPYRDPLSHAVAERVIAGSSGTSFDPMLVEIFKLVTQPFSEIAQRFK